MRLRNKNWTTEFLEEHKDYLIDGSKSVDALDIFGNKNDLMIDIGCGKGAFVTASAVANPNTNYIALEKEKTVVGVALRFSIKEFGEKGEDMKNLRFCNSYIEKVENQIRSNSVKRIYLNFSDPWPKARHAKYRLTGREYLKIYDRLLDTEGEIHIKTDNDNLYQFTLEEAVFSNFRIILNVADLYQNEELLKENIQTEYERKFVEMGIKIKKIILRKKPPKQNGELNTIEIEKVVQPIVEEKKQDTEDDFPF